MTDLIFPNFRAFDAAPDDPLRLKWQSMAIGTMRSYAVGPTLTSVWSLNVTINTEVKFDSRESYEMSAWQTPQQTLTRGMGDCKDYALLKYSLLTHKGIDARVVFGEIRSIIGNKQHAWCAVQIDDLWYAMDNLFDKPEPVATYVNWTPSASLHDQTVTRYGAVFSINDVLKEGST